MIAVIILSTKFHLNPDNIATPIAASLGDVTTLGLLACIASFLYEQVGTLNIKIVFCDFAKMCVLEYIFIKKYIFLYRR